MNLGLAVMSACYSNFSVVSNSLECRLPILSYNLEMLSALTIFWYSIANASVIFSVFICPLHGRPGI